MKALWSFRKCKEGNISRVDLILSLFSVIKWKQFHPEHETYIYLDSEYMGEFQKYGLLQFWDNVELLESRDDIDVSKFWSISKMEAFQKHKGKVVHVDNDFIPYCNLEDLGFFDCEMGVTMLEEVSKDEFAYIDPKEAAECGGLKKDLYKWDDYADQCSILYFDNDKLKNKFTKDFFKYAKEVTGKKTEHDGFGYILFIEQKYLRELSKDMKVKKNYIVKDGYKLSTNTILPDVANGKLPMEGITNYIYHYGPNKQLFETDLTMGTHLGIYILPMINRPELNPIFWNIYAGKPFVESKPTQQPKSDDVGLLSKLFRKNKK